MNTENILKEINPESVGVTYTDEEREKINKIKNTNSVIRIINNTIRFN